MSGGAYLAGPIFGTTDDEANGWRERVKALLSGDTHDPMDRDYRGYEAINITEIVEGDKDAIDRCAVVIVYFEKPSVGTAMETMYAWENCIPVVVVNASGKPLSPWLVYHSTVQLDTLEQAAQYVNEGQK